MQVSYKSYFNCNYAEDTDYWPESQSRGPHISRIGCLPLWSVGGSVCVVGSNLLTYIPRTYCMSRCRCTCDIHHSKMMSWPLQSWLQALQTATVDVVSVPTVDSPDSKADWEHGLKTSVRRFWNNGCVWKWAKAISLTYPWNRVHVCIYIYIIHIWYITPF